MPYLAPYFRSAVVKYVQYAVKNVAIKTRMPDGKDWQHQATTSGDGSVPKLALDQACGTHALRKRKSFSNGM